MSAWVRGARVRIVNLDPQLELSVDTGRVLCPDDHPPEGAYLVVLDAPATYRYTDGTLATMAVIRVVGNDLHSLTE
jgi:hypothetical protein